MGIVAGPSRRRLLPWALVSCVLVAWVAASLPWPCQGVKIMILNDEEEEEAGEEKQIAEPEEQQQQQQQQPHEHYQQEQPQLQQQQQQQQQPGQHVFRIQRPGGIPSATQGAGVFRAAAGAVPEAAAGEVAVAGGGEEAEAVGDDDAAWWWEGEWEDAIQEQAQAAPTGQPGGVPASPGSEKPQRKFLEHVEEEWWRVEYEASAREAREGAAAGHVDSLYTLGLKRLLGGQGCARDIPQALRLLSSAADQGHGGAQSTLAFMHAQGLGVPMSRAKAMVLHSFAAHNGSTLSQMALGYQYLRQQDYGQAVSLYAQVAARSMAANRLPGQAQLVEGVRLNDGVEENREATRFQKGEDDETIQYIEFTAAKGNVHAMRMMGRFLYWGARGMPRDHVRALAYFQRAAELGDVHSMLTLGEMLARGVGTPGGRQDEGQAMRWFRLAAEKGFSPAHNGIGFLYARGRGVRKNYTKAMEHFRRGGPDGLYNLGVMQLRGFGMPQRRPNPKEALKSFRRAVWQSMGAVEMHMGALFYLARMHHEGVGTPRDLPKAAALYKAVAEQGPWGVLLRWAHDCYMGRCTTSTSSSTGGPSSASVDALSEKGSAGTGVGIWKGSSSSSPSPSSSPGASPLHMMSTSFLLYARAAELGYEVAQSNAAWLLDRLGRMGVLGRQTKAISHARSNPAPSVVVPHQRIATPLTETEVSKSHKVDPQPGTAPSSSSSNHRNGTPLPPMGLSAGAPCVGPSGYPCSLEERQSRSLRLWRLASEQGNVQATLLVGDAYFYGRGVPRSLEKAVEAYRRAKEEKPPSAQACFNLGFMHERGLGLPPDLHLAKRYYDEALAVNPRAALPVTLALGALWLRTHHPDSVLIKGLDWLPDLAVQMSEVVGEIMEQLQDDGNRALLTLAALLGAVLVLRARIRRPQPPAAAPGGGVVPENVPAVPAGLQ